jgi:SulP family sulfate permease
MGADWLRSHWLFSYRREWLRADAVAGLTAAAVVIPQSMAYATIAGLGVEYGLYVALAPMLVYALLGSSRPLSVSCTSTIAILSAHQLALVAAEHGPGGVPGAAATLALLAGAFLLLAGIARLGFIANFISDPVLTGFKGGIGLVIVLSQLPKLLGVHVQSSAFFRNILAVAEQIPFTHLPTLLLSVLMFALLFGLKRFVPRAPAPLIAVAAGIGAAAFFGLQEAGIALAGRVPAGIPAPALPDLSLAQAMWPGALGIALMSFTESIAAGRAFTREGDPRPRPARELFALGAANLAAGFFHGFPAGGGTSQTAVNAGAGARTQAAELVTFAVVVATLLFLSPLIALLPQATLAAVVVATSLSLLSPKDFRAIRRVRFTEYYWALAALAGVVVLGTLQGIAVAVAISILTLFYQAANPLVYAMARKPGTDVFRPVNAAHPGDQAIPGLLIARTEGRLLFASAPHISDRLAALVDAAAPKVVIFDCSGIPDIEYTGLHALTDFERKLAQRGIALWLCALNPAALEVVQRSPLGATLGRERMFFNLQTAVAAYEARQAG